MKSKIIVCGDVHGRWGHLNMFLNQHKPEIVLQCGDFGYWPKESAYDTKLIKPQGAVIHWCDGNHEDHATLLARPSNVINPGIEYQPRGSTMTLPDGRVVLFFGGADSYDKNQRTIGFDWFREELPTDADIDQLDKITTKVDIVISHTCPTAFKCIDEKFSQRINDPTRKALDIVLERFKPSLWYFGHWHMFMRGTCGDCHWTVLNYAPNSMWWIPLD